ncbi:hypothetical protein HAX54_033716 [Datura stramonium]|uniref:Uncharacterized protein n=1 Tax=Datura stramonium TaxID=4076 RepID=A0ABS8VDH5_DATST|nr:hypothetical protein [Datura stramonium]
MGPIFYETRIWDDNSLSVFLHTPEMFCNVMRLTTLDIYARIQRTTDQNEEQTNNEFDIRGSTSLPSGLIQPQTMAGFASHSNYTISNLAHKITCHNFGDNPSLTQLVEIVNHTELANDQSDDSNRDRLHDYGEEDDQLSDEADNLDEDDTQISPYDDSVNYHFNVIPYLDHTEEGPDDIAHY